MRQIIIPSCLLGKPSSAGGRFVSCTVLVDWWPLRTDEQLLENAIAAAQGVPEPHPNPNLIEILIERTS